MQCGNPHNINKGIANNRGIQSPNSLLFLANVTEVVINIPQPILNIKLLNNPLDNLLINNIDASLEISLNEHLLIKDINRHPIKFPNNINNRFNKSFLFIINPAVPVNNFNLYLITVANPNINKDIPIVLLVRNPNPAIPIHIPAKIDNLIVFFIF